MNKLAEQILNEEPAPTDVKAAIAQLSSVFDSGDLRAAANLASHIAGMLSGAEKAARASANKPEGDLKKLIDASLTFLSDWTEFHDDFRAATTKEELRDAIWEVAAERGHDKGYGDEGVAELHDEFLTKIAAAAGLGYIDWDVE